MHIKTLNCFLKLTSKCCLIYIQATQFLISSVIIIMHTNLTSDVNILNATCDLCSYLQECNTLHGIFVGSACGHHGPYFPDVLFWSVILFFTTFFLSSFLKQFKTKRYFPTKVIVIAFILYMIFTVSILLKVIWFVILGKEYIIFLFSNIPAASLVVLIHKGSWSWFAYPDYCSMATEQVDITLLLFHFHSCGHSILH